MREQPGLGALTAAQVPLRFSPAGRIHSEAAFAMLLSTAPVPASSGRHRLAPASSGRHRLAPAGTASPASATASSTARYRSWQ